MKKRNLFFLVLIFVSILMVSMKVFSGSKNLSDNHSLNITIRSVDKNISKEEKIEATEYSDNNQIKKLEQAIAITFDDGPNEITTPKILDILKNRNVQATFFMLGENANKNEKIVKRIFKSGHEIGNHSFSHRQLTLLSDEEIKDEIDKTDQVISKIIGQKPKYIRPPYGSTNSKVAELGRRPFIEWSVDSRDWESKNKDSIIEEIKSQIYPGSILLFHDIQPATVEALPEVINFLYEQHYQFVTISQLLGNPKQVINYYGLNDNREIK